MKKWFLDEDIIVTFTCSTSGYHTYRLSMWDQENNTRNLIYLGQFYCENNGDTIELYLSDIINNNRYIYPLTTNFSEAWQKGGWNLYTSYYVDCAEIGLSKSFFVYHAYRYPNNTFENFITFNWNDETKILSPLLQTTELTKSMESDDIYLYSAKVLPHFPWIATDNYGIPQSFYLSCQLNSCQFHYLLGNEICKTITFDTSSDEGGNVDYVDTLRQWYGDCVFNDTLYVCNSELDSLQTYYTLSVEFVDAYTEYLTNQQKKTFLNAMNSVFGSTYPFNEFFQGSTDYGEISKVYTNNTLIPATIGHAKSFIPSVSLHYVNIYMSSTTTAFNTSESQNALQRALEGFGNDNGFTYTQAELSTMLSASYNNNSSNPNGGFTTHFTLLKPFTMSDSESTALVNALKYSFQETLGDDDYTRYFTIITKGGIDEIESVKAFSLNFTTNTRTEVTHSLTGNYLSSTPISQQLWDIDNNKYIDWNFIKEGNTIDCPHNAKSLHIGLINTQDQPWNYVTTWLYTCSGDTHIITFKYNPSIHTRIEFSLRDNGELGAPNNELGWIQWDLATMNLISGNEYTIMFTHTNTDNEDTVYLYSMIDNLAMPVAKIDQCPARYYVMWQDRLGGIQSQAFECKNTYSESMTYNSLENYKNHRRNYNVQVQSKWELNTGWIKDYEYPIYESILVSPYVLIYDTKLDKSFMVIPSDKTYTEKTWKNQKKLFNISFTFELDKKQNILA